MTVPVSRIFPKESYFLYPTQLLISILLLFLPVTKYFSYESSVIHGFMIFLLSGYLFINISAKEESNLFILIPLLLLMAIEPVVRLFQSLLTGGCSYFHGLKFYLISVLPAAAVSFFLSKGITILYQRFRYLVFIIILILLVFEPLIQFYVLSQVFLYNPVIYFFPGTIYDELIRIDSRLLLHRGMSIIGIAFVYLLLKKFNTSKFRVGIPMLAVILYYTTIAPAFGFITTEDTLKRYGYKISETENFYICHPAELPRRKLEELKSFHEFQLTELKGKLEVKANYKIRSFIYRNSLDKGKLFGSEGADVAKPWKREIHTAMSSVFSTLRHELAHILASEFSNPPFYVAGGINPWIIEGLAVYADFSFDDQDIPRLLATMSAIKEEESGKTEGTVSFFRANTRFAYLKAGLIFNEIATRYGKSKLKEVYRSADFEAAVNVSSDELFRKAIASEDMKLSAKDSASALYYFKSMPFLLKSCPRYLAEEFDQAVNMMNIEDYEGAEKTLQRLMIKSNDSRYIMAYAGLLEARQRSAALYNLMDTLREGSFDINIRLKKIDAGVMAGVQDIASKDYEELLAQSPNLRYEAVLNTRLLFIRNGTLKQYLTGTDSLKKSMILPEISDSTGYLLLLLNNHSTVDQILKLSEGFPQRTLWTEYVKLLVARRSLVMGERETFIKAINRIQKEFLPTGSLYDYDQLMRYSRFITSDNLSEEK